MVIGTKPVLPAPPAFEKYCLKYAGAPCPPDLSYAVVLTTGRQAGMGRSHERPVLDDMARQRSGFRVDFVRYRDAVPVCRAQGRPRSVALARPHGGGAFEVGRPLALRHR